MANVRQDNVQIKLEIDGSQSRTELDNLSRKSKLLQEDLKGLKKGTQEWVDKNKEIRETSVRMGELQKEIGLTSLNQKQLGDLTKQLARELSLLTPSTESFVKKSQELIEARNRLEQVKLEANGVKEELDKGGNSFLDFVKKSATFAGISIGLQEVFQSVKQLFSESIDAAAKGSDSIADMEKSLNVTTAGAKALREQLEGIDTRTSQEELEKIAVAGGQLGVAAADVDEFTVSVDQAVVALGDEFTGGVDDVTKSIGGLQKLFKETADLKPDQAITKIGSALNALGADGAATAPVVAEFTARIGQLGDLAPEISQTLGLGAAFQELGLSAEISSGGVTNVLLTASKETEKFSKQLGLTDKEFRKLLNSDPNEVLLRLAESLKGASNTEIVSTLDQLGIKSQEATKVVSLLANQTDLVRQKQALASAEFAKGTSLYEEFVKKNTNAAAQVEKAEKSFAQFRQELGEQLIPIYIKVLHYGGLLLDVLKAAPRFLSENRVGFGLLALAMLAYNAEQIKAQASALRLLALQKLKALGVVTEVAGEYTLIGVKKLSAKAQMELNAAMTANPIGFVIGLLALLAFGLKQLYDRSETFRAAVDSLSGAMRPLGAMFGSLMAQLAPLAAQIGRFFGSIGGGSAVLEFFGYLMGVSVVLPLKLFIANIQLTVDALVGLWDVGKRVANFFGAEFKVNPNGSFDALTKNLKANIKSIGNTLAGTDGTPGAGDDAAQVQRAQAEKEKRQREAEAKEKKAAEAKAARERALAAELAAAALEEQKQQHLQHLKLREQALQRALLHVQEGSQQELQLKKQLVLVARDIELTDEKKTGDERVLIRGKAQIELDKLNMEFAKKQSEKARKEGEAARDALEKLEQEKLEAAVAIQKRLTELETNAYVRREATLRAAAAAEGLKLKGSAEQIAEQRRLIEAKLQQDLLRLEQERVQKQIDIARRIEQSDLDIALRRLERRKQQSEGDLEALRKIAEEEKVVRLAQLASSQAEELDNENLTADEKLAIVRRYEQGKAEIEQQYAEEASQRNRDKASFALSQAQLGLQVGSDFAKIESDKELARAEKDKKARLLKLDQEFKAGVLNKEQYEAQKSSIEANYDQKTRTIKRQAAEKEKEYNIAQAIIAGTLAVIEAAPNVPLQIATGIAAAAGVAKIIATPIPEFAKGGVAGAPRPGWRERVRQFATGGINSTAGVAGVGQRHSGGGIRMVDGATGEHLGEWERGEPYMILSRETYANNKHLVDDLLDTSMNRGGAPVRSRYYEAGGVSGGTPAVGGSAGSQELVQAQRETTEAIRALPSRFRIAWDDEDTSQVEERLEERAAVRSSVAIR